MSADRYYNQSDFEEYIDEPENNNPNQIMEESDNISTITKQKIVEDNKTTQLQPYANNVPAEQPFPSKMSQAFSEQ